jgi:hypothetical protein
MVGLGVAGATTGTAKRLRKNSQNKLDTVTMATVTCDQCGEQFAIGHRSASQDPNLAGRQAHWLEEKFVWDHIQESRHHGSIRLPESHDLK